MYPLVPPSLFPCTVPAGSRCFDASPAPASSVVRSDVVMVWLVAWRWTRAHVPARPAVVVPLHGPGRKQVLRRITSAGIELGRARGDVVHDPVPPTAARRCVGIVHRDCVALGLGGRATPGESGRGVAAGAAHAVEH